MTKGQFVELILDPGKAAEYLPDEIGSLVEQFPYCQPLRFLQLRCFAGRQSIQYPSALKITSAYAPDRSRLFHLMNPPTEAVSGYRSAIHYADGPETVEITVDREELKVEKENESSGTPHLDSKEEVNQRATQVTSRIDDDIEITQEPHRSEPAAMPHPDELLSDADKQALPKDDTQETDAQELLILRLKELNLWPEDEEETINEDSSPPPARSLPDIQDFYPLSTGPDDMEEEVKDEDLQFEYEKQDNPSAGNIQPVPTDYFSLPGTTGDTTIVLNNDNRDASTGSNHLEARQYGTEKLTFSEWLKSLGKETQPRTDKTVHGGIQQEEASKLANHGQPEKRQSGSANSENRRTDNAKSKVIYPRDATGNGSPRPTPSSTDETTVNINQLLPSTSDKPSDKKPLPDPMLVATDPPKSKLPTEQLIDKFITEEPRITPSKSTFYSPVNMARKSVMETEDLVTETLAGIFARQGNFQKAIQYYEKLTLKFPEKSRYFAGLIEELKKKLNS